MDALASVGSIECMKSIQKLSSIVSIRINSLSQFYVSATVSGLMSPTESGSELIDEKMKLCMASE